MLGNASYALMSIAHDRELLDIQPDYSKSEQNVFLDIAIRTMTINKSLSLLELCVH